MKSQLKKRVENLEAKKTKPTSEAEWAASFNELRVGFAAIEAESRQRDALPLAEQLRIHREELEAILTKQAENKLRATHEVPYPDDAFLQIKEKMQRCCIQQLEAKVLHEKMRVDIGLQPDFSTLAP